MTPQEHAREVVAERARLATLDPEGEREALSPMDGVWARQFLLELADLTERPKPQRLAPLIVVGGTRLAPDEILARLGAQPGAQKGIVRCPTHEDRHPSLSWRLADDRVLLHCFAGCTFQAILEALR